MSKGIPDYPQRIVIELTARCNLSCSMCPRKHINISGGYVNGVLFKRLVDEISEVNPQAVIIPFWRGESLLHPHFRELMEYALDRHMRIHISTNGHVLTEEHAAVLSRCEFVTFSIHTSEGYTHAKEFLSLKRRGRPTVQISFVRGEKTTEKFLELLTEKSDLDGFDAIRLYEEHTVDGIFGRSGSSLDGPRKFCQKLLDTIVVAYDGRVSRCNHMWLPEREIDVNELSIKGAWKSLRLSQIRSNYPDELCKPCDQWTGHTCGESWRIAEGRKEHKIFGSMTKKGTL